MIKVPKTTPRIFAKKYKPKANHPWNHSPVAPPRDPHTPLPTYGLPFKAGTTKKNRFQ
ncbi:hypothetical protein C121_46 [Stenotrophomonas phage C121]|uniref:hypothetical protein n=1 Tax=Stenotrophomonas phage C121 TaxID=2914029 RepID=UPI00232981F4|nr:hypothetical protein PP752_gp46 [Stenotrophomonas phage C121]UKL14779.1 hypothetical protein C121_46 [Stenotrophomonas phage C121]